MHQPIMCSLLAEWQSCIQHKAHNNSQSQDIFRSISAFVWSKFLLIAIQSNFKCNILRLVQQQVSMYVHMYVCKLIDLRQCVQTLMHVWVIVTHLWLSSLPVSVIYVLHTSGSVPYLSQWSTYYTPLAQFPTCLSDLRITHPWLSSLPVSVIYVLHTSGSVPYLSQWSTYYTPLAQFQGGAPTGNLPQHRGIKVLAPQIF